MELNKDNIKKITGIVFSAVILSWLLKNYELVFSFFGTVMNTISPFIIGGCLAFVLNIFMNFYENKIFKNKKGKKNKNKVKRPISMVFAILTVVLIITMVFWLVIPELISVITKIIKEIPTIWDFIQENAKGLVDKYPMIVDAIEGTEISIDDVNSRISGLVVQYGGNILNTSASIVAAVFGGIFNFIISVIFAVYILLQKEQLKRQAQKMVIAYLDSEKAKRFLYIAGKANKTFVSFLTGQFTEAIILGSLCCIGMLIFRIPYAVTVGVLVGFTALIPVVGAFIGLAIGCVLILAEAPSKVLGFIIYLLILQQIENNLIYPKVVGNSVGLPAIWVLFAITVGGTIGGVVGILLSVPVCSILYTLLQEDVTLKLKEKGK